MPEPITFEDRLVLKIVGGQMASMTGNQYFNIGEQNLRYMMEDLYIIVDAVMAEREAHLNEEGEIMSEQISLTNDQLLETVEALRGLKTQEKELQEALRNSQIAINDHRQLMTKLQAEIETGLRTVEVEEDPEKKEEN